MRLWTRPLHQLSQRSFPLLQRLLSKWRWKDLTLTMFRCLVIWAAPMGRRTLRPRRNRRPRALRKCMDPHWIPYLRTWPFSPMAGLAAEALSFSLV